MKRVVITGGTGFVGANLVRAMLADGHETHLLVRTGFKDWRIRSILPHVALHRVDLRDDAAVRRVLSAVRPDWIFHLAAYGAYEHQDDLHTALETNLRSTTVLLQAAMAVGFESFVHAGSSSEYGPKDHAPLESEGILPNSYYAVTKSAATLFCGYVGSAHHLNVSTLRLYSVYGPYEDPNRLIPTMIERGMRREFPPLVGRNVARDFIYIDDVVSAFITVASAVTPQEGKVFNVGTGKQTTIAEVAELSRAVFGIEDEPRWGSMAERKWDTTVWVANPSRLYNELGWCAQVSFPAGFQKMVDWLTADGQMMRLYAETGRTAT